MIDVFIDESGNLGKGDRFFIISAIQFESGHGYEKWQRLAKKVIKNTDTLKEIKSSAMSYNLKKKVLQQIEKADIRFRVWLGVIDTDHDHYKKRFISDDNSKELAFNYALNHLFGKNIAKIIQKRSISICLDQRSTKTDSKHSLEDYLNAEFLHDRSITVQNISIQYCDSKNNYGVQLSDLVANITYTRFEYNRSRHLFSTYIQPKILGKYNYPQY